jgi:hypothetical protein
MASCAPNAPRIVAEQVCAKAVLRYRPMKLAARLALFVASVSICGFFAQVAFGRRPPHPPRPDAAVAVYVEQIPTAGGSVPATTGTHGRAQLSPSLRLKLHKAGGGDAAALAQLATAPGLGAPEGQHQHGPGSSPQKSSARALPAESLGAPQSGWGPLVLAFVLVVVTVAMLAARFGPWPDAGDGDTGDADFRSHPPR